MTVEITLFLTGMQHDLLAKYYIYIPYYTASSTKRLQVCKIGGLHTDFVEDSCLLVRDTMSLC